MENPQKKKSPLNKLLLSCLIFQQEKKDIQVKGITLSIKQLGVTTYQKNYQTMMMMMTMIAIIQKIIIEIIVYYVRLNLQTAFKSANPFGFQLVKLDSDRNFLQQSLTIQTVKISPANLKTILLPCCTSIYLYIPRDLLQVRSISVK